MFQPLKDISFGHITETFDFHQNYSQETSNEEIIDFLKKIKENGDEVAALKVFCSDKCLCQKCDNPRAYNYSNKFLCNLFERFFLMLNYRHLLKLSDNIYKVLMLESEDFYKEIEIETKNQSNSKLWYWMRAGRITASIFKICCNTKIDNPSITLMKEIAFPNLNNFSNTATEWGKSNEKCPLKMIYRNI